MMRKGLTIIILAMLLFGAQSFSTSNEQPAFLHGDVVKVHPDQAGFQRYQVIRLKSSPYDLSEVIKNGHQNPFHNQGRF